MRELRAVVIMGVAGAGKTSVGRSLAARLGWHFIDADDLHSRENRTKMASGVPLCDDDRRPWLEAQRRAIDEALQEERRIVLASSALKRAYRHSLGTERHGFALVHLEVGADLLRDRLERREGHFMPASLLTSQLADLEPPEDALRVAADRPLDVVVEEVLAALRPCRHGRRT